MKQDGEFAIEISYFDNAENVLQMIKLEGCQLKQVRRTTLTYRTADALSIELTIISKSLSNPMQWQSGGLVDHLRIQT